VEVVMRPPEVFVRPLAHEEALALKSRAKKAKHFSTRQRAAILLASSVGSSVPQIAQMWLTDESHVRRVIHEFNERGMASLDPEYRGGRPAGSPASSAVRRSRWPVPVPTSRGWR
jgi:transposase